MMQNISAPSGQQELLQDIYKDSTNQYTMLCVSQVQYNLLIKLYGLNKLYIFYIILSYSEYFL